MSMNMNSKSSSRTLFSGSAEDRSDAIDWELRPGGMLVQRRDDGDAAAGPMIKVKVSQGSYQREVSIPAQATFGDLKKLLSQETGLEPQEQRLLFRGKEKENDECLHIAGVKDMAKVILLEDPASKEKKLEEMKRNQSITKACQAIAAVKGEVVKLSVQVSAIYATVNGGTKVADNNFIVVTEMLMIELLKLDNIEAEGEVKVHRRVEVSLASLPEIKGTLGGRGKRMTIELGYQQRPVLQNVEFYIKTVTAFLVIVLVAAWSFFLRRRKGIIPPGPFPLPIIGNLHMLGKLPHRALAALSQKYGPLMSLRLGSAHTLVVSSPEMATEFLKTHDQLFASRASSNAAKCLTYNCSGLEFSPYGPYWRRMRKLCNLELLSPKRLDYFRFIREEEVAAMIRSIINSDDSGPLNINQTVSTLATAIICRMAFSIKYSDQELRGFNSMVRESFLLLGSFNIGDYIPFLDWMDLQGFNRQIKRIKKTQDYFLEKVIDDHVAENDSNAPRDLVDALLAASADSEFQLSRDNIKAVLFDMLLGGSDTAPRIIEWAISEVLKNPTVLRKLQQELEQVVGFGRMVCESDLPRLVYLQAVVKETLRLYPQGPFLFRHLSGEACNVLGYEIPQNTGVIVNVWAIGRNPKSWKNAECFQPERFMEEIDSGVDARGDQNLDWLPFGAGRRRCPGQQLGTLVAEFGVAQLLHCFNWRLPLDDITGKEQELDMTERFDGIMFPRADELFAIPTPRLECFAHLK